MRHVKCPEIFDGGGRSLFLVGGITGCGNWQSEMVEVLNDLDLVLLNPRRDNFVKNDENERAQIKWEFEHFKKCDAMMFWFPHETLCPITLYELGKMSKSEKKIFIGIDPKYERRLDVEVQINLERPEVEIVYSLKDLADQIKRWENV